MRRTGHPHDADERDAIPGPLPREGPAGCRERRPCRARVNAAAESLNGLAQDREVTGTAVTARSDLERIRAWTDAVTPLRADPPLTPPYASAAASTAAAG